MDGSGVIIAPKRVGRWLTRWLLPVAVIAVFLPAAGAETRLEGTIEKDQVWEALHGPYRLVGSVRVRAGATVTIPAEAVVRFENGSRLEVEGGLFAEEAVFDGVADLYNRERLVFHARSDGRLDRCIVQNLEVELRTSRVQVTHSAISNRNGSGITVGKACRPTITRNDFRGNSYYAVYKEGDAVLHAPHNYWGAEDGPSGAGPGQGDAVNPPIDFMPFENADIDEHLVLVTRRLDRNPSRPGGRFTLTYGIANLNSFPHTAILGATIYQDADHPVHSPVHDLTVTIEPGYHEFSRSFALPETSPEGVYTVLWGVMKTDLSAYYALVKEPARLRLGAEMPASEHGPGWGSAKPGPFQAASTVRGLIQSVQ